MTTSHNCEHPGCHEVGRRTISFWRGVHGWVDEGIFCMSHVATVLDENIALDARSVEHQPGGDDR